MLNRFNLRVAAVAIMTIGLLTAAATAETCTVDVNDDGSVNFADILDVIGSWGPCHGCPADVDGNGVVDFGDILDVIGAWGTCPQ